MGTLVKASEGAVCSTWSCPRTVALTCGHPHMGGITPQACEVPACLPCSRQSICLPQNPVSLWDLLGLWDSQGPMWSCLRQQEHREGAFLKRWLMRTRKNPSLDKPRESKEWPERRPPTPNPEDFLNAFPPNQESPAEKGLGFLVVRKLLSSFWGGQGEQCAAGSGRS